MKSTSTILVNSTRKQYIFTGFTQEAIGSMLQKLEKLHKWDLRIDFIYISHTRLTESGFTLLAV